MLLSNWILGRFEVSFIISLLVILIVVSWLIYWRRRTNAIVSIKDIRPLEDVKNVFPKPAMCLFVFGTIFIILFRFYHALLFPITNWDSLTEFAYLGRLYFTEGRIPTISGATLGIGSSANYPPLVPLLYTWFYLMTGGVHEIFAKAISPIYSLLTVIVTYSLAREMYKSKTLAISSVFFLVTVPIFMFVSEECLSDIVVTSILLSSMYFLYLGFKGEEHRSSRLVLVGGVLAGVSAFTKYTGLVSFLVGLIGILSARLLDHGYLCKLRPAEKVLYYKPFLVFVVGFLIFGAPWYVRNLIVLGNPIYPLLYQVFGGKDIDVWMMQNSWDAHFSTVEVKSGLDLSLQGLVSTYYSIFFKPSPYEVLDLGPFLGAFFAIGVVFSIKRRERADVFLLIWALSYLVLWRFAFRTFLRYLSIVLPALAIVSARGLACIYESIHGISKVRIVRNSFPRVPNHVWLKIIVFLVLFEGFLLPSVINGVRGYKTWVFVGPFETREGYLRIRFQGTWQIIEFLNRAQTGAVVLTYDHSLAYYVERKFVFSDEPRAKPLHLAQNDAEVSSILASLNISFIVTTTAKEEYFPLLKTSYFYKHLDDGNYAQLVLDRFPSKVYAVKH